jgi:hypothetical protein
MNFVGKVKETKIKGRKMRRMFGTEENTNPFPPEYYVYHLHSLTGKQIFILSPGFLFICRNLRR